MKMHEHDAGHMTKLAATPIIFSTSGLISSKLGM